MALASVNRTRRSLLDHDQLLMTKGLSQKGLRGLTSQKLTATFLFSPVSFFFLQPSDPVNSVDQSISLIISSIFILLTNDRL